MITHRMGGAMAARYRRAEGRRKPHLVITRIDGRDRAKSYATEEQARGIIEVLNGDAEATASWLAGGSAGVAEACRGWFATYKATMSPSTQETALGRIENHLAPHFGNYDLRLLDEPAIIKFVEAVIEKARAADPPRKGTSVAEGCLSVLRTVCSHHVRAGLLTRNPLSGSKSLARRVSAQYEEEADSIDSWTVDEMRSLITMAREKEPYIAAPLLFLFHTGCRRGEALGLRWDRIDFARRKITIARARVRGVDRRPKSGDGRKVPMSPELEAELQTLARKRPGVEGLHTDPGYVFLSPRGHQWQEGNFSRAWRRLRTKAAAKQIRPLKLHCARHTFATLALEGGRSIRWVAETLGHADPALTLRTYAHVLDREDDDMAFLSGAEQMRNKSEQTVPVAGSDIRKGS